MKKFRVFKSTIERKNENIVNFFGSHLSINKIKLVPANAKSSKVDLVKTW